MPDAGAERYGPDEDADYLSVLWGILRVPVACAGCGTRTHTPCYAEDGRRLCGSCYRAEMWPPKSRAEEALDPPPSAPGEELAAARPSAVAGEHGKVRRKAAASGRAGNERPIALRRHHSVGSPAAMGRGVTGGTDGP